MSLLDLIAAAGEEFTGLLAAGAGSNDAPDAVAGRIRRHWAQGAVVSSLAFGGCLLIAVLLPPSPTRTVAAYGVYLSLTAALISALGWAYSWATHRRATSWPGRDA